VIRLIPPAWLAGAVLALAGPAARAAPLPVRLSDADPRWRLEEVEKRAAPGLTLAAVAIHAGAPDRLILLTAPAAGPGAVDPDEFARRITAAFTEFTCVPQGARNATRAGFAGRVRSFELTGAHGALDCELFVFTDAGSRWGILYAKPPAAGETAAAAFGLLLKNVPLPAGTFALKPVRVRNTPLTTFPLSFQVRSRNGSNRVATITITAIPDNSEAERAGIQVGDEIVAIDGRMAADFTPGVGKDDELGRIFINRQPGDSVTLEIRAPGAKQTFTVTLHAGRDDDTDSLFGRFGR
jgi:PDZ domain